MTIEAGIIEVEKQLHWLILSNQIYAHMTLPVYFFFIIVLQLLLREEHQFCAHLSTRH